MVRAKFDVIKSNIYQITWTFKDWKSPFLFSRINSTRNTMNPTWSPPFLMFYRDSLRLFGFRIQSLWTRDRAIEGPHRCCICIIKWWVSSHNKAGLTKKLSIIKHITYIMLLRYVTVSYVLTLLNIEMFLK